MIYCDIPCRVWRKRELSQFKGLEMVSTQVYRRVMKRVGQAIAAGMAVEMDHRIANPNPAIGKPYDTITVRISE